MTFIHLSLLSLGSLCVAIPVAIHLLMRRRPKHQVFPALRFVTEQRQTNQRRLRLRHWLLLALRCGALAAFASALARPTVAAAAFGDWIIFGILFLAAVGTAWLAIAAWSAERGLLLVGLLGSVGLALCIACLVMFLRFREHGAVGMLGGEEAPVSAVLLFDTSPRMQYQEADQSRLQVAQEHGRWLLSQLPDDSEIGVLGGDRGPASFALDRTLALQSIDSLQTINHGESLPAAIIRAHDLLKTGRHARHELYLFTDLTSASWRSELDQTLTQFDEQEGILLHVVDVGSTQPRNAQIDDISLSQESLAKNGSLTLRTNVLAEGTGGEWSVELLLEDQDPQRPIIVDGKPVLPERKLRGQQTVSVGIDSPQPVEFSLANLGPGIHHGEIRLRGHDGLDLDNVRYFTIEVTDAWPVLVAASPTAVTSYLTDALAPLRLRETGEARFRCDVVDFADVAEIDLMGYRAAALLDPAPLTQRQWRQLTDFVQRGGGLAIFLGREVKDIREFSTKAAEDLLPGPPKRQWSTASAEGIFMSLRDTSHPALRFFQPIKDSLAWNQFPIYRHWTLGQLTNDSVIVMRYSNDQPAIIERVVGAGRVLLMTTPISDPLNIPTRPAWNVLPTDMDPTFFMLINELFEYLAAGNRNVLNHFVGQPVSLTVPKSNENERFQLFIPSGSWQDTRPEEDQLTVTFTDPLGWYRLRSESARDRQWGFAVNLPANETRLDRVDTKTLDSWLGTGKYHLARDRSEINRGIVEARIGRELYPWLVTLTALLLLVESLVANRFYHEAAQ